MDTLQQPEKNDVAFHTFIGVLVSVCGNVSSSSYL